MGPDLDLPLSLLIAVLVIKEGASLFRFVLKGRVAGPPDSVGASLLATRLDVADARAEILSAVRCGQDELHERISGVSDRLARLEGSCGQ